MSKVTQCGPGLLTRTRASWRGGIAVISNTWTYGLPPSLTHTWRSSGVNAIPWPGLPVMGTEAMTWPVVRSAIWKPLNPTTSLTISVPRPFTENGASTPPQQKPEIVATTVLVAVLTTYIVAVGDLVSMHTRLRY